MEVGGAGLRGGSFCEIEMAVGFLHTAFTQPFAHSYCWKQKNRSLKKGKAWAKGLCGGVGHSWTASLIRPILPAAVTGHTSNFFPTQESLSYPTVDLIDESNLKGPTLSPFQGVL